MPFDAEAPLHVTQRDILIRAREYISQGWCTLLRLDSQGNMCLRGAIAKARGVHPEMTVLYDQNELTALLGFHNEADAMAWNDVQTSSAPVLARFDAAIEALR